LNGHQTRIFNEQVDRSRSNDGIAVTPTQRTFATQEHLQR
jgi:hypothetical protein